jgi:hypothetical protein
MIRRGTTISKPVNALTQTLHKQLIVSWLCPLLYDHNQYFIPKTKSLGRKIKNL